MPHSAATRAEARRLRDMFAARGAEVFKADVLQPAGTLLDLYGEDIRARAYLTSDPLRGEIVLRPDFTVPVVQWHMENNADPARYTYAGKVFRKQESDETRANEFVQVGFEIFGGDTPAAADAEVFAAVAQGLDGLPVVAATGDIGLLMAAVRGLRSSQARKDALLRHIWRPRRFRSLLNRFSGKSPVPASRLALLAQDDPFAGTGAQIGLRSRAEVAARIDALRADAAEPPLAGEEVALIDAVLALRETMPNVLSALRDIAVDMPAIAQAVTGLEARMDALARHGVAVETLAFEGNYGRTTLEYYDGFVFGFAASARPDIVVASGGRYDALTAQLGQGRAVPAVGGVIRPDLALGLK